MITKTYNNNHSKTAALASRFARSMVTETSLAGHNVPVTLPDGLSQDKLLAFKPFNVRFFFFSFSLPSFTW